MVVVHVRWRGTVDGLAVSKWTVGMIVPPTVPLGHYRGLRWEREGEGRGERETCALRLPVCVCVHARVCMSY